VGREKEFSRVTGFIDNRLKGQDVAGRPILFVTGQSGIGKSRLMRELRFHAQLSRQGFIEGNCYESSASEYGPLAEVLGYLVALAQASGADNLLDSYAQSLIKVEPNLSQTLKTKPIESSGDAAAEQLALMEDISSFILQLSHKSPFAVYINDLQWARKGTVNILSYLIERIAQQDRLEKKPRLALMGSYRDDEIIGKPIEAALNALKERGELETLILGPFDEEQVNLVLKSMLGVDTIPEEFGRRVMEETAGNPFFVESVMRVLVENGTVYLENGEWAASTEVGEIEIPSISEVFLRRISLLEDTQRTVLEVIAVCGLPTSPTVINKVCQMDSDIFHEALTVLLQRQMVKRAEGTEIKYVTNHDRMRETVYHNLELEKLKGLHQGVADTIESVYAENLDLHFAVLARHYSNSDNKEKALKYCIAAGNQAKKNYANELAIEMYEQVLELLPEEDHNSPLMLEVNEKLADCGVLLGQYSEANTKFNYVLEASDNKLDKSRLYRKIGDIHLQKGELLLSSERIWTALNLVGVSKPKSLFTMMIATIPALMKNLYLVYVPWRLFTVKSEKKRKKLLEIFAGWMKLGYVYYFLDPSYMPLTYCRSTGAAEKLGSARELVKCYSPGVAFYGAVGLFKTAFKLADKAFAIAKDLKSDWDYGSTLIRKGIVLHYQAKQESSLACSTEALEIMLKRGDMFEISMAYIHMCFAQYYLGRCSDMIKAATDGTQIMERTGAHMGGKYLLSLLGLSKILTGGNAGEGLKDAEKSLNLAQQDNEPFGISVALVFKGQCFAAIGQIDKAIAAFEECKHVREKNNVLQDYIILVYVRLAQAYLEKIYTQKSLTKKERRKLLKLSKKMIRKSSFICKMTRHPNFKSSTLLAAAQYNWIKGKRKKASKLFARSRKIAKEQSAKLWLAEAYHKEGEYLVESGGPSTLQGSEYLKKALELYQECGALVHIPRLEALLGGTNIQKDA
jgi:tetratricopeptide (TPR) repeat protein